MDGSPGMDEHAEVHRIASLLPSTTEIACALGFETELVARSHECDHPHAVSKLPALTQPKLDIDAPSLEIDHAVKRLVGEGLSVYRVDADLLRELAPSVILTQDQCDVCAASPKDLEKALETWLDEPPKVVSTRPSTLGDVWRDIQAVAAALDAPDRGTALNHKLAEHLAKVAERSVRATTRPRVACIEWIEPLMAAGNWMPELVTLAGGTPLLAQAGAHSPWLDWEDLRAADPDVVIVLPCGFDVERSRSELSPLLAKPGWSELRAVQNSRVYLADGHHFFNRPGPRIAESLDALAEMIHPKTFPRRSPEPTWQFL
ncbi:cobalamin-binding protein [Myxococcota bacterium]|nr:cobalamin-binding protein [Myxococcota bacterium]